MKLLRFLSVVALAVALSLTTVNAGNNYHVTTNGSSGNSGADVGHAWDLTSALTTAHGVQPDDTINIHQGTYRNPTSGTWGFAFTSTIAGTAGHPVVVRAYPGDYPVIDGLNTRNNDIINVQGSNVTFWGLEIMSSANGRLDPTASDNEGSYASGDYVQAGIGMTINQDYAVTGIKLISCTLHDGAGGIASTGVLAGVDLYNCLIYNNGWYNSYYARGQHGHGVYIHNVTGRRCGFHDCIDWGSFENNVQAWGGVAGVENNDYVFDGFVSWLYGPASDGCCLLIGNQYFSNPTVTNSFFYSALGHPNVQWGYYNDGDTDPTVCTGGTITGNIFAGGEQKFDCSFSGTTINNNSTYYQALAGHVGAFPSGFGQTTSRPTSNVVIVRPSQYETGRANIIVYNWQNLSSISVDLSAVMSNGNTYRIIDAQNPSVVIATGTYTGPVSLPMNLTACAQPLGNSGQTRLHTPPEFNVFIVTGGTATVFSPAAPVANAASGITTTGFAANWGSSSGATGYRVDIATNSSFSSYVSGYQNYDAGSALSVSVTGLSASTSYYYRVKGYNSVGTSSSSNVITTATTAPSSGNTYYIDQVGGNDANAGTSSGAAWKTIGKVNGYSFNNGDNILLKRACTWAEGMVVPRSGLHFGNYGSGAKPLLNCSIPRGFDFNGKDNITVDGIDVTGADRAFDFENTIGTHVVTVTNCRVNGTINTLRAYDFGLYNDLQVTNALFDHDSAFNCIQDEAFWFGNGTEVAQYCYCSGCLINFRIGIRGVNCKYLHCIATNIGSLPGWGGGEAVNIEHEDPPLAQYPNPIGSVVSGCWLEGATDQPAVENRGTNTTFTDNIIIGHNTAYFGAVRQYQPVSGAVYYNNTIISDGGYGVFGMDTFHGTTLKNNILVGINGTQLFRSDNNTYDGTWISDYNDLYGTHGFLSPGDSHSITTNPLFTTNYSDLHLQSSSPCINAGTSVGLTTDFDGNLIVGVPDIGAYEHHATGTVPIAPTANAASGVTTTSFTVNWSSVAGATGYTLDVATNTSFTTYVSGFQNLNVALLNSLNVPGLTAGTPYYFRIRAYNGVGTSGNSNVVTITTTAISLPSVPTANAASGVGNSSFTANWSAASGATGYFLDVATNTGFTVYVVGYQNLDVSNSTSRNVVGLSLGTTYYYRLRAANGVGTSGNSNTVSATTVGSSPSATPVAISASSVTSVAFTANWGAASGATGYRLDVSTLTMDSTFHVGDSVMVVLSTDCVNAWTVPSTTGSTASSCEPAGRHGKIISGPSADVNNSSNSTFWQIAYTDGVTGWSSMKYLTKLVGAFVAGYNNKDVGNVTSSTVQNLTVGATYNYRVRSYNANGTSGNSNTISVTTTTVVVQLPTGSLTPSPASRVGAGTVNLIWIGNNATTASIDHGVGNVASSGGTIAVTVPVGGTTFTLTLSNAAGSVSIAATVTVTGVVAPPTVITNPASAITTGSVQLNGSVNPGGVVASYHFDYGTTTGYGYATPPASIRNFSTPVAVGSSVTNLSSGQAYHFRVSASNNGGASNGKDVTFTTAAVGLIQVGSNVMVILTTDFINLRNIASTTGSVVLKMELAGAHGVVVAGPSADVHGSSTGMWWKVTFSDGNTGWTMAKYLVVQ
jgi:phosphodiesterase/alkaline phosphatase D-like protein